MGERYIEVFPCSSGDIASIIASSTINQSKLASFGTIPYTHPCSYPMTSGVVTSNSSPINGHTDSVTAATPCCSPTGVYLPHSPTYFNCVLPANGIGGGAVSYYPPVNANFRMRMSPYILQPYDMVPFFQGYQVR